MAGYSVTFSVVDEATAKINQINQRIRQMREPIERQARAVQQLINVTGLSRVAAGFTAIGRSAMNAYASLSLIIPAMGALTGAATIAGMARLVRGFADWAVALRTDADRIGTTAQQLEVMQRATVLAGGSADDLTESLKGVTEIAANVFKGLDPQALAWFNRLNINLRDAQGHLRQSTDLLPELAIKIAAIENPADRATAAIATGGQKLADYVEDLRRAQRTGETLAQTYDRLTTAAKARGAITDQEIQNAQRFTESVNNLSDAFANLAHSIGAVSGGPLSKFFNWWADNLDDLSARLNPDRFLPQIPENIQRRQPAPGAAPSGPTINVPGYGTVPNVPGPMRPGGAAPAAPAMSGDHAEFLKKAWPLAQKVAAQTGLDPRVVLAQAALESGWGQHATGQNYFGIKPSGTLASYGSMEESFQAYSDLINRRYGAARAGKTPAEQIAGLVSGGYTHDAGYAQNLNSIVNSLSPPSAGGTAQDQLQANFAKRTGLLGPPGDTSRMVTISGPDGTKFTVNKLAAPQFKAFLDDLHRTHPDYPIVSGGGYNPRTIRGSAEWSEHAYGAAIDINPATNPMLMGKLKTDLPSDIGDIAARHGIKWGGSFHDRPDPMHFEIARLQAEGKPAEVTGGPPVNGSVDVTITHKNPPPGATLAANGTGDVNLAPPRTERQQLAAP